MELILIRHAESEFNAKQTRHLDSNLTRRGQLQAIDTGVFLQKQVPDILDFKFIVSPFLRTYETYKYIISGINAQIDYETSWDLKEHIYENAGFLIEALPLTVQCPKTFTNFVIDKAENEDEFFQRLKNFWNRLDKNGKYVIISHGTPIQTLMEFCAGVFDKFPIWDKSIKNCSVSHFKDDKFVLYKHYKHQHEDLIWNQP